MSVADNYPERPPENLSSLSVGIDPLTQVEATLDGYEGGPRIGNQIEAGTIGSILEPAVAALIRQMDSVQDRLTTQAHDLIRQTQARHVLEGLVFESINQSCGDTQAFLDRDSFEQNGETAAEALWRERMADYTFESRGLRVPPFSSGINIQIAPLIATGLPFDAESAQAGYIDSSGMYKDINSNTFGGRVNLSSVQTVPIPILGKIERERKIKISDEEFSSTDDPSYHRNSAAQLLADTYRSFAGKDLATATLVETIAVLPGVSGVGNVMSLDFCVNLNTLDYSSIDTVEYPDYWVELMHNGQRQGGSLMTSVSDRRLGSSQDNKFLHFPPLPETLPAQPNRPFAREKEDGTISLIVIPVKTSSTSPDGLDQGRPIHETKSNYGSSVYLQSDPAHVPILTHIRLVGSY